jgi:Zn-dependent protease with chaperone function
MVWLTTALMLTCILLAGATSTSAQILEDVFQKTDPAREVELGRRVAKECEKEIGLSKNQAYQNRVERIGRAIVESLPQKAYPYEFKVLASQDMNAFSLPGGFIYIYEGLLSRLSSDDEVAWVLGHELAHASHRHWHRQVERMKESTLAVILASVFSRGSEAVSLAHTLMSLSYSRELEEEADKAGLEYMWSAGFDPNGALRVTQLFIELEKGRSVPTILRTHPHPEDRLKRIRQLCDDLKQRRPQATPPGDVDTDLTAAVGQLPDVALAANPWFPLAVGSKWTYSVAGTGATYTVAVAGAIGTKQGTVYRVETTFEKGNAIRCQMLTTAGAVWRRTASPSSPWELDCVLDPPADQPCVRGEWTYSMLPAQPVTVPCGSFQQTLGIRKKGPKGTYDMWFAKGVGLVKRVCVESGVTETLVSYKIAGQ